MKQTFTTGAVLTAQQMTNLQATAMLGGAANAKVASYVLVAADAGDAITMSNASPTTITVNTGLFAAGDIVTIINLGAGATTITAGTATVATSGSLVLATNQGGVLRFTSASAAIFFQFATPASGDIEGVTAGTGISGGGTSGTVTVTNSMATAIDAKGDLIVGTGADTFSRLAVGTNTYTLVADSAEATGLKWAAPGAAATSYALINTGGTALSGTTTTITGLSGYNKLMILAQSVSTDNSNADISVRFNTDTGSNYTALGGFIRATDPYSLANTVTTVSAFNSTALQFIQLANYSPSSGNGYLEIDGANSSGIKTIKIGSGANNGGGANYDQRNYTLGGYYKGTSVISSVSFISGSGSYDTGTIYIYGAN
jgi:hypothetical protein